jgi:hypothetical protein
MKSSRLSRELGQLSAVSRRADTCAAGLHGHRSAAA